MILSEENYRKLQKNDKKKAEENGILLAFYNDALFSSEDDLGTYGMEKKSKTNWESRWQREDEIDFLSVICRHCPAGGETVENKQPKSPADLIKEMQKMHLSYLNAQYDPGVLEQWKKTEVKKNAKETCSLYDYVEEKMGYRFVLRKAETDWRGHILSVEIENTGFGNLTKEAECFIEYEQKSEKKRQVVMTDPRKWDSGACQYLKIPLAHENFPRGEKIEIRIGLFLKDRNRPIRFANALAEETLSLGLFGYF